ncbi:nuclear hormone receptor HR96-like isoform X4 [Ostrea edulis]|uniref:nuclear hormone receptor HR96-like isoform X4 n=3 Tax=Ostrea edulis TaxID=37623 RepID=UPI0024AF2D96|nr:nuclear hormone receptor HR96-like isoform X4 [Ostrea edulis]
MKKFLYLLKYTEMVKKYLLEFSSNCQERFTAMEQVRDIPHHAMGDPWHYGYTEHSLTESMSTSDEYGEYYGRDAASKREQKRRPKPKDGTLLICGVCGDKALGYNFDAITCESCKAFFRRNALKAKVFACSFDGNCKLDTHTRKFCSGCRLKKCFDIGMKKDWILSEDQLAKRRQKVSKQDRVKLRKIEDGNPMTACPEVSTSNYHSDESSSYNQSPPTDLSPFKSELDDDDYPRPLSEEYRKEIQNLEEQYAVVFDQPYNESQFKKLTESPRSANDLFNLTDIFIRRLIKFAKHVPEFKQLQQEDQIHLLKGGIMEIMVLRSVMGFDAQAMAWKVRGASMQSNNICESNLSPEMIKTMDTGVYSEHVKFVMSLNQLTKANKTILTLLFVIELFSSDRPSLKNKELVAKGQEKFSTWLQAYLESIYPVSEARQLYPKLLMKLLDVRSLGESSAQLASHLDITRLEPLLVEIFSLQK